MRRADLLFGAVLISLQLNIRAAAASNQLPDPETRPVRTRYSWHPAVFKLTHLLRTQPARRHEARYMDEKFNTPSPTTTANKARTITASRESDTLRPNAGKRAAYNTQRRSTSSHTGQSNMATAASNIHSPRNGESCPQSKTQ